MTPHTRAIAAGVLAASALLFTACSSATDAQPKEVPTLPGSADKSKTAETSAAGDEGRPRERLDMTNEERDAMAAPYNQCLSTNGYDDARKVADEAAMARAESACEAKDPLPPWELDVNNPQAADFVHAVVECLRDKGVEHVSETPPAGGRYTFSFGGDENDSGSVTKGLKYLPECEKQVAAQGIGR